MVTADVRTFWNAFVHVLLVVAIVLLLVGLIGGRETVA